MVYGGAKEPVFVCDGSIGPKVPPVHLNPPTLPMHSPPSRPQFAGTVLKLGTQRHHDLLLRGIDTMDDVGCFALTELGFGGFAVTSGCARAWACAVDACAQAHAGARSPRARCGCQPIHLAFRLAAVSASLTPPPFLRSAPLSLLISVSLCSRVVWRLNLRAPPPSAGNNAVEMLTTAHYDAGTDEFIIHTPNALAQASPALRCAVLCHNMQVLA